MAVVKAFLSPVHTERVDDARLHNTRRRVKLN